MSNFGSRVVLYVVFIIGVIGWVAAGFQACRVEKTEDKMLEVVTPALHKEGYVQFDVDKIEDKTLPPGVRTVAVGKGSYRYGPVQSQGPRMLVELPGQPSPGLSVPPSASVPAPGAEAPCDLNSLTVDINCRLEIVGLTVGDREWFGRLLVSGAVRDQSGNERTLPESKAKDIHLVVDKDTVKKPRAWWAAVRAGASTAPGLIVGGSIGRGRYGAWASYEWRETGNEASGGIEIRW